MVLILFGCLYAGFSVGYIECCEYGGVFVCLSARNGVFACTDVFRAGSEIVLDGV